MLVSTSPGRQHHRVQAARVVPLSFRLTHQFQRRPAASRSSDMENFCRLQQPDCMAVAGSATSLCMSSTRCQITRHRSVDAVDGHRYDSLVAGPRNSESKASTPDRTSRSSYSCKRLRAALK
ncbi:hypothetical protein E4U58_004268 [Claviceps cyperi]|nr:hypothetical protein E4U58_004268 [Claviceps cyperi]